MPSIDVQPARLRIAFRKYVRNLFAALVLHLAVLSASFSAILADRAGKIDLPDWTVPLIALAPVAPVLLVLHVYLTVFRELDELQKRIQREAIQIAAGVVGFGAFAYALLEVAAGFPSMPGLLVWILPAMVAVWGLAVPLVYRRYR